MLGGSDMAVKSSVKHSCQTSLTLKEQGSGRAGASPGSCGHLPVGSRSVLGLHSRKTPIRADALPREVFRVVLREGCLFPQQQSFRLLSKVFNLQD